MALHKDFPKDPYTILDPDIRWFPAVEDLREKGGYERLLPPFISELRRKVKDWRDSNYVEVSETSKALLSWWFKEKHTIFDQNGISIPFRYYFSQREAVETVIWLSSSLKLSLVPINCSRSYFPIFKISKALKSLPSSFNCL